MRITRIEIKNFKGCKSLCFDFYGKNATVSGANASGKTTIFDSITWLLFGKDSLGSANFESRPLDSDGKQIDNVEISVTATFDMENDKTLELKKVQKQNWVKKRGTENPVLQGNVNSFEVDGYPKSEKEFKEFVNGIVSDDLFKMLTNPMYFPNMPWKEQRSVVMKLASNVSDVDMAKKLKKFEPLLDELEKAPSTDDIKAKYQKSINELKKKQTEIPIRIDEANNNKVDIDVAELELQKNSLNEQICEKKSQIVTLNNQMEKLQKISDELFELQITEGDFKRKANAENTKKIIELEDKINDKKSLVRKAEKTIFDTEKDIEFSKKTLDSISEHLQETKAAWESENERVFDENSLVCSYCGQEYPAEKKEQLRAEFESKKASTLKTLTEQGNIYKKRFEKEMQAISDLESDLAQHKESLEIQNNAISDLEKQLPQIPTSTDLSDIDEYKDIQKQIKEKETAMSEIGKYEDMRSKINSEVEDLQSQLIECEKQIAMSQKNVEIDERISELQAELKEVGIKIASQEKIQYLLDEFIKYKLNKISGGINSMFDGVNFKLFDIQLNGGVKEVCECTVNGIPYGSLNNGHRIVAGLQIIKALQKMYGVYLPIFIDNAESLNDFNIPDMNCQLVKLKVADNKDLRIEVE